MHCLSVFSLLLETSQKILLLEPSQKDNLILKHKKKHNGRCIQGLRGAIRDLRRQSSGQLSEEVEARRKAVGELEAALEQARKKEVAAAEANAELSNLRSELAKTQEQVQVGILARS